MNGTTRLSILTAVPLLLHLPFSVHERAETPPQQMTEDLLPSPDQSWQHVISTRLAAQEYEISSTGSGFQAPNREHDLRTEFTSAGMTIAPRHGQPDKSRAWHLGWETTGWGRAGRLTAVEGATLDAGGDRVEYERSGLLEWYVNTALGLEQGFVVEHRPPGSGPLLIAGQVAGGLAAELSADRQAIDFLADGTPVLHYGDLHVYDRDGQPLIAWLAVTGDRLTILADDRDAAYPVLIDPLMTNPAWSGESNQASAGFGSSVATAGDVNGDGYSEIIVGAFSYSGGDLNEGRAFVYDGSPIGPLPFPWGAEPNENGARFGEAVAPAGDVNGDGYADVLIGAPFSDFPQPDEGQVALYLGSPTGLGTAARWLECDQANAHFGSAVAAGDVNGDGFSDVIVGAPDYTNGENREGAVFVYHGSPAGQSPFPDWIGEGNQALASFGGSVAAAGDVNGDGFWDVIVGASGYDNDLGDEGRAWIFLGSPTGLESVASWQVDGNHAACGFGGSVRTAGDVNGDGYSDVVVGASHYDNGSSDEGAAFAFCGSASGPTTSPNWSETVAMAISELDADQLYHWRLRVLSSSPFAPRSRWLWLPDNAVTEGDLRTAIDLQAVADTQAPAHHPGLSPAIPNPFSSGTQLVYDLPRTGRVQFAVYDVQGRCVAVLADATQPAGRHAARWNGRDNGGGELPPAVYFVRLESEGRIATQKLVLMP